MNWMLFRKIMLSGVAGIGAGYLFGYSIGWAYNLTLFHLPLILQLGGVSIMMLSFYLMGFDTWRFRFVADPEVIAVAAVFPAASVIGFYSATAKTVAVAVLLAFMIGTFVSYWKTSSKMENNSS